MALKRFILGAAVGAGAMYLLDPDSGPTRRRQAMSLWAENKDQVFETARTTSQQVQSASQQAATVATKAADTASKVAAAGAEKVSGAKSEGDGNKAAGEIDQAWPKS